MVSSMCKEAGVKGEKTNHSLRVAGASALFEAGVPERLFRGGLATSPLMHCVYTRELGLSSRSKFQGFCPVLCKSSKILCHLYLLMQFHCHQRCIRLVINTTTQ